MTFCRYCAEIKKILGIEQLTEVQAKYIMSLYLNKVSVEDAAKKLNENSP